MVLYAVNLWKYINLFVFANPWEIILVDFDREEVENEEIAKVRRPATTSLM